MNSSRWIFLTAALAGALALALTVTSLHSAEKSHKLTTVSLRKMADALHAVIAADRQTYAELVAQHPPSTPNPQSTPASTARPENAVSLPNHAHQLRTAALRIQQRGAEFSYTLRSLNPINPSQGPQTEIEEKGLHQVTSHPDRPLYTEELLGGRSYFTAVYPDRATLPACVECHNQHPDSPRRDYRTNDVLGALVIRIPLEF